MLTEPITRLSCVEAEEGLLGSILINPDALEDVGDLLPTDFYLHKHRWIWDAVCDLAQEAQPIDTITVSDRLDRKGQLSEVGGAAYLAKLIGDVPMSLHAEGYAQIIKREAMRRRMMESASELAKAALNDQIKPEDFLADFATRLIDQVRGSDEVVHISEVMSRLWDRFKATLDNPETADGMKTGFVDLDEMLGGLYEGELTLLSGEPGCGKSILAVQIGEQLAVGGHAGAIFEMEMPELQVARRMVSARSKVSTRAIRKGLVADADIPILLDAMNSLTSLPVYISTSTRWTTARLRVALTRLKRQHGVKWFVADYFDLFADEHEDQNARDTQMARNLKNICKDLGLAGLVVHSMNKVGMAASKKRMEHLGGAGKIAYAADNVIFVSHHQPDDGGLPQPNMRTLIPAKIREGEILGAIELVKLSGYPAFGNAPDPRQKAFEAAAERRVFYADD